MLGSCIIVTGCETRLDVVHAKRDRLLTLTARRRLASPLTATILGAAMMVFVAGFVALLALTHSFYDANGFQTVALNVGAVAVMSVFGAVGTLVARRQPHNAVGWLLLWVGLLFVLGTSDAQLYLQLDYGIHHGTLPLGPLAVMLDQCWPAALLLAPLAILLFPDGRLPSSRWRWVMRVYVASAVGIVASQVALGLAAVIAGDVRIDSRGLLATPQPRWLSNVVISFTGLLTVLVVLACWIAFVGRQVFNFRRSTGERRQQLKWVMCGAAISAMSIPLYATGVGFAAGLGFAALPISIGVGILKYRLYEIDRLLSRTVSYAVVTGLLISVYFGVVTLTTRTLPFSSPVGVAAATLAAAALFNPVRRRVQRVVDRRFNRARYDADATVSAFSARLRDAVDLDAVQTDLVDAVVRAVQPAHISVWIKPRS